MTSDELELVDRALTLVEIDGGRQVRLSASPLRIGREPSSDLCLTHSSILPSHAQIISAQRSIRLHCSGPTWINGRAVRKMAVLQLGDRIQLGEVRLKLVSNMLQASQHTSALQFPGQWTLRALQGQRRGAALAVNEVLPAELTVRKANGFTIARDTVVGINGQQSEGGFLGAGDQLEIDDQRWILESARWIVPSPYDLVGQSATRSGWLPTPRLATVAAFTLAFSVWLALLIIS